VIDENTKLAIAALFIYIAIVVTLIAAGLEGCSSDSYCSL
jgi:hypothetical protein